MAKEILIYNAISEWTSSDFIKEVSAVDENEPLVIRMNTVGGNPECGFGMIAKLAEHKGEKTIKVDGRAHSMGLFFLAYADNVEALDVSEFLLHRAAYPEWFEKSDYFTEELKGNMSRINTSLRKAFETKIDVAAFEKLKGVTLNQIFSTDSRVDCFLSAKEAKKIGLVNKIVKITPEKAAELNSYMVQIAAKYNDAPFQIKVEQQIIPQEKNQNTNKMTIEELKSQHPALYASVYDKGNEAGVKAERDRVAAWLVYVDVDAKQVCEGVDKGAQISAKEMAELNRKAFSKDALGAIAADNAEDKKTVTEKPTEPEKGAEAFLGEVVKTFKKS